MTARRQIHLRGHRRDVQLPVGCFLLVTSVARLTANGAPWPLLHEEKRLTMRVHTASLTGRGGLATDATQRMMQQVQPLGLL